MPGNFIILDMSNKNYDHIQYCYSDTACDRCNFYFSFWIFFPFYPQQPKNQNLNKMKKTPGDINILHSSSDMVCNEWTDKQTDRQKK